MSWGILDLVGFATMLVFAAPLALAGAELLVRGNRLLGGSLLAAALGMVVVERYITTPGDLPGLILGKLAGVVARPPDEE